MGVIVSVKFVVVQGHRSGSLTEAAREGKGLVEV